MMKQVILPIIFLLVFPSCKYGSSEEVDFSIGALLDNDTSLKAFNQAVISKHQKIIVGNLTIRFRSLPKLMSRDSIETAQQVCDLMEEASGSLAAVVVSYPYGAKDDPPLAISFTASYYKMPVISVSARHSTFSDKYSHPTFLRTVPPYSQEAQIFARLIEEFKWEDLIVIRIIDDEGNMFLSRLERASEDEQKFKIKQNIKLSKISESSGLRSDISDEHTTSNLTADMIKLTKEQNRAVILYADADNALRVFREAKALNMFSEGWAWVVSEDALQVPTYELPPGIIGVRLETSSLTDYISDAVDVVKFGIKQVAQSEKASFSKNRRKIPSSCEIESLNERGSQGSSFLKQISNAMWQADIQGATGNVSFDRRGDREQAIYSILHVLKSNDSTQLVKVGRCSIRITEDSTGLTNLGPISTIDLDLNKSLIKWPPGNWQHRTKEKKCVGPPENRCSQEAETYVYHAPISFKKKTLLRVVTQESVPFVYKRLLTPEKPCDTSDDHKLPRKEVPCNHTDPSTGNVTKYCCYGYNIDLLRHLARPNLENIITPFRYSLHLVGDGQIGEDMGDGEWNGIVQELLSGKADLAVAPMSITAQRAARIAFTKPFKYLGLTILVKRSLPKSNLVSFLQPFDYTLWVLVSLSVHVVALVLYLLDRFSPFGRYKLASSSDTEEDALNLASAMWFAWGVLLNSGIGEGTPRSFSARVLGMVWAGFSMIIVASYTANLAAFLVLDRPEALISGIDDARMRNPTKDFVFATVKNSSVEMFFKRRMEYATMFRTMEQHTYYTVEDAIEAVRNSKLNAFIWDSARLNYEASAECDLMTAGEVFGRFGYGLAMAKGSPWLREMSQAVLKFHELGVMEHLDSLWILNKAKGCPPTDTLSPATLGLTNMAGVFIMVAAGIVAGVFLIFIEMAYKKRTGMKEKELELAKSAADRWRGNIEKRKVLRRGRAASHFGDLTPSNGGSPHTMFVNENLTESGALDHKRSLHHFDK